MSFKYFINYISDSKVIVFIILTFIFGLAFIGINIKAVAIDNLFGLFEDEEPIQNPVENPKRRPCVDDGTLFDSGYTLTLGDNKGKHTPLPTFAAMMRKNQDLQQTVERRGSNNIQTFFNT